MRAPTRGEGDRESTGSKGVNVEKGKGSNEKDEERRSAGYSVPPNRLPRVQVRLKVGRNFLMYVGESIGRWLAFILQPGGLNRDMPIPPLLLTSRNGSR